MDQLYHDPRLAQFYDLDNAWGADQDYCVGLAGEAGSVLDLGCGSGRLAAALVDGRSVVGVDPAGAMLDIARDRPGGDGVTWVEADARDVRLQRRFDLVVLTGHAFQVFLTDQDQLAVLSTISAHLNPDGRFVFDTRNPAAEAWLGWTPTQSQRRLQHPELGEIEAWNDAAHDAETGVVTYETHYRVIGSGQHHSAASNIRFIEQAQLVSSLAMAGLQVDTWLGDWHGGVLGPDSPDFIPIGRPGPW